MPSRIPIQQRPERFLLNRNHRLFSGLVYAGLGQFPGGNDYHDSVGARNCQLQLDNYYNGQPAQWTWNTALRRWGLNFADAIGGIGGDSWGIYTDVNNPLPPMLAGTVSLWFQAPPHAYIPYGTPLLISLVGTDYISALGISLTTTGCVSGETVQLYTGDTWAYGEDATTPIQANELVHITLTWDANGFMHLYANGVRVIATDTLSKFVLNTPSVITIGNNNSYAFYSVAGHIVDPCIWNRCLSTEEIKQLANPADVLMSGLLLPPRRSMAFTKLLPSTTYIGTGIPATKKVTVLGAGSFTYPIYSGSGSTSIRKSTVLGAGTFTQPIYSGTGIPATKKATVTGTGTFTKPIYSGSGTAGTKKATVLGSGVYSVPIYSGSGSAVAKKPTVLGAGTFTAPVYAGVGIPATRKATVLGAGSFTAPSYSGSGAATTHKPSVTGSGVYTPVAAPVSTSLVLTRSKRLMLQRPDQFKLNIHHPLATGLTVAGLGQHPGSATYYNSAGSNQGTIINPVPNAAWYWDLTLRRWGLDLGNHDISMPANSKGYVQCNTSASGNRSGSFCAWIRVPSDGGGGGVGSFPTFMADNDVNFNSYGVSLSLYGSVPFMCVGGPNIADGGTYWQSEYLWANGGATMTVNRYYHVAAVWNDLGYHRIYVDGVQTASSTALKYPMPLRAFRIGCNADSVSYPWTGQLLDPVVFDRAISAEEVKRLANPDDVTLGGLILPPRRRSFAVASVPSTTPVVKKYPVTIRAKAPTRDRPSYFTLNRNNNLWDSLYMAGLGQYPGTSTYVDSAGMADGTLVNYNVDGAMPVDKWSFDDTLRRWSLTGNSATSAYVSMPPIVFRNTGNTANIDFTISAWSKISSFNNSPVWGIGTSLKMMALYASVSSTLAYPEAYLTNGNRVFSTAKDPSVNVWHHLSLVRKDNTYSLYRDGAVCPSTYFSSGGVNKVAWAILGDKVGPGYSSDNSVADVIVHKRALSAEEIAQLADPSNVLLSGLILPARRKLYVSSPGPVIIPVVPDYSGSGSITSAKSVLLGSGTFTQPSYAGTGTIASKPIAVLGTGTFTAPVYTGTGALATHKAAVISSGVFTAPVYSGSGSVATRRVTVIGGGSTLAPVYTGTGTCVTAKVTVNGSGTYATAVYTGTGSAATKKSTVVSYGVYTVPSYIGVGAVATKRVTVLGAGNAGTPTYDGQGSFSTHKVMCAGIGTYVSITYIGSGNLVTPKVTCSGSGTFGRYTLVSKPGRSKLKLLRRPPQFTLNRNSSLYNGLAYAGLGQFPGSSAYNDACNNSPGVLFPAAKANTSWELDPTLRRWVVNLDGINQAVSLQSHANIGMKDYTISMWVCGTPYFRDSVFWSAYLATFYGYMDGSGYTFFDDPFTELSLGLVARPQWRHVLYTRRALSSAAQVLTPYLDGVAKLQRTTAGKANLPDHSWFLGCYFDGQYSYFHDGKIADFCVWDRALSSDEIARLADPSNVMMSGLIAEPRRTLFTMASTKRNLSTNQFFLACE